MLNLLIEDSPSVTLSLRKWGGGGSLQRHMAKTVDNQEMSLKALQRKAVPAMGMLCLSPCLMSNTCGTQFQSFLVLSFL